MSDKIVKLSKVFTPHFLSVWKIIKSGRYLKHVFKGGRSSGKSTHIAIYIILLMMAYPITFLCVRKVARTLEESCFEQLKDAIEILGVENHWTITRSPLRLTYKPRGNRIIFRGADDPQKIKSIKVSKFPLAGLWVEETAEFKTEDDIGLIEKSVLRAELPPGLRYFFFYSYNPPKRKQNWVNKKYETKVALPKNVFVHHSTYLDNPFISKAFVEEAEEIKNKNIFKYRWEYMGEAIGAGVVPFDNLSFREITDEEIARFDNIRQGLDWGYAVDPVAFVRMHYDKTRRRLYIFDEFYKVKASNRELAEWITKKGYDKDLIIADSAEPKSVDELKSFGVRIKGAKKGPGSVEYGEKWLDDLEEIIIDPVRCKNVAHEFENIDYQTDKDGNVKSRLEDVDNHGIDATRYGCEDDQKHSNKFKAAKSIY